MKNLTITIGVAILLAGCYAMETIEGEPSGCRPECDDGDPCTEDFCDTEDNCHNVPIPGCGVDCTSDADCDDGIDCTVDYCDVAGTCQHVDLCEEPECDESIHGINLPTSAVQMSVASGAGRVALAWRESDDDFSAGYYSLFDPADPPEEAAAATFGDSDDNGIRHIRLLWIEPTFRAFWSSFDGSGSSIKMKSIDIAGTASVESITIYNMRNSSLSEVVLHPNGEMGISWSDIALPGANYQALFGRFTLDGEVIEIIPVSETDYSYGPRIAATENGYAIAYTDYLELDGTSNANIRDYSFSDGLGDPLQLNEEMSNYKASSIVVLDNKVLALWHLAIHDYVNLLYSTWIDPDGSDGSLQLDLAAQHVDTMNLAETGEALVAWCTPPLPDSPSTIKAVRVNDRSMTLVMYQEITGACIDLRLSSVDGRPTIFWLNDEVKVYYRSLCH